MLVNNEAVRDFLPHREPFLFIDFIESIEIPNEINIKKVNGYFEKKDLLGCTVIARYYVKEEMEVLRGHFPGNPIVPGVVQVEMMAQASCFTLMKLNKETYHSKLEVALLKIEEAKFRKPIRPGMDLKIIAVCKKIRAPMMSYDCKIFHGEEVIAEASLLATANIQG